MKIFLGNSQLSWHNNPFIYFIIFVMVISIHLFAIVFDLIRFVEASEYEDSPFGFLNPYIGAGVVASDNLKDLNVHWLRKGGGIMAWVLVEPEKGTFDWEYTDNYIETVTNDNMNVLITIRPTSRWDLESCGKTFYRKKDYTPCSWNDYKNFLEKAFNRYKDRVKYWQIGNEENHRWAETERDYAELVKFTYNTLKENCNDCKLVLSGPSNPEGYYEFYLKVLEELDNISEQGEYYFDIFDFHLFGFYGGYKKYTHPDSGIEYDIKEFVNDIKTALTTYGYSASIWVTEVATYSDDPVEKPNAPELPLQTEKEQAEELFKRFTYFFANGVKKVFWVTLKEWHEFGGILNGFFDNTGLINNPRNDDFYHKKLSYYTYKLMVEKLDCSDLDNIQTIQEAENVYAYKFTAVDTGKPIWIAWNDNEQGADITIAGISSSQVKITEAVPSAESGIDLNGDDYPNFFNTDTVVVENSEVEITLGACPVFIEIIPDSDVDGIPDDGDNSGVAGDSPCAGGVTENCDDNCPFTPNGPNAGTCSAGKIGDPCMKNGDCGCLGHCSMDQEDADGDGIGDVCDS